MSTEFINKKNYYISYTEMNQTVYGDVTTALVDNRMCNFLILLGDHRDNLNRLNDYKDCLDYIGKNLSQLCPRSNGYVHGNLTSFNSLNFNEVKSNILEFYSGVVASVGPFEI